MSEQEKAIDLITIKRMAIIGYVAWSVFTMLFLFAKIEDESVKDYFRGYFHGVEMCENYPRGDNCDMPDIEFLYYGENLESQQDFLDWFSRGGKK